MPEEKEMSFWGHLEELRWVVLRSVIALFIFAMVSFFFMPYIFDNIIMAPASPDFFLYRYLCKISAHTSILPDFCDSKFSVNIINIKLASQFFRHVSSSFWLALILTCPYLFFELWRFVSPALYEHERKNARWVFFFGSIMFFIGCLIGYCLIFPIIFRFLAEYQLSESIVNQISLDSYMDNFILLIFIMGVIFELPLVSWLLSQFGLLKRSFFKKYRQYAIIILLIVAAGITPSGDPFTLAVVFFPLFLLYEMSRLFVKKDQLIDN